MTSEFLERFKNKCSTVSKEGEVGGFGFVAKKPPRPSNLRNAGANILDSQPRYTRPASLQQPRRTSAPVSRPKSQADDQSITSEVSTTSTSRASSRSSAIPRPQPNPKPVSAGYGYAYARSRSKSLLNETTESTYKPYTIQEYKESATNQPVQLGGLGPANIGSEDWNARMEAKRRQQEYARSINQANMQRTRSQSLPRRKEEVKMSTRQRAIEFAKNIPKPRVRVQSVPRITDETSKIDEILALERDHLSYADEIARIKANFAALQ